MHLSPREQEKLLIVVAAVFLWVSIGQKLAVKLGIVDSVVGG